MIMLFVLMSAVTLTCSAGASDRIVTPLRQLELVTGERLNVEFLGLDGEGGEFRWRGQTCFRLPLAALRSLANPPGVIDHWLGTEGAPHRDQAESVWRRTVTQPLASGELSLWFRPVEMHDSHVSVRTGCRFSSADEPQELQLRIAGSGAMEIAAPATWRRQFSQPLRTSPAWSRLAIRWNGDRCEVTVNDALHSVYQTDRRPFVGLSMERVGSAELTVEQVTLREFNADVAARTVPPRDEETQDIITLTTGDRLFGRLRTTKLTKQLHLQGPQGDWSGDWRNIVRLDLARRPLPPHLLAPVDGWCFDLRLPSQLSRHSMEERVRAVQVQGHRLSHPWLGEIAFPAMAIKPTSYGYGEFRWLEPDRRHLGDEIRLDLSPSQPVGTLLSGTVDLPTAPTGDAWIVVDVAELEPSGPDTLPTQPFLEALRGGGLRTELIVNDRIITDLNRFLSLRPKVTQPERLWLPVPAEAWRVGKNVWTFRQQPLSPTQRQYDDAEIGRVGLWIRHTVSPTW